MTESSVNRNLSCDLEEGGRPQDQAVAATTTGIETRFWRDCLNAKSKRSAWCTKAELNDHVDSENNHGGSSTDICITSDWMFTMKTISYCVK